MRIEIRKVTEENRNEILALHVSESQKSFIESTEQCLKEAEECECYQPAGLYRNGELVGFAMYGFFPKEGDTVWVWSGRRWHGRVWLDRYLIDERFQGQGLGRIMLEAMIAYLSNLFHCNELFLSIYESNEVAQRLYQNYGFHFNGERDTHGEKVMVKVL